MCDCTPQPTNYLSSLFRSQEVLGYRVRLDDGTVGFISRAWSVKREPGGQYLRSGAWNLKKLGHGEAKDFSLIGQIIKENFDLVAIIEVMQKQHAHPGYDVLMQALGEGWGGLVTDTPRPNTGSGNAEYYAIAYRQSEVSEPPFYLSARFGGIPVSLQRPQHPSFRA